MSQRKATTATVMMLNDGTYAIHFNDTKLQGDNLWLPLCHEESLFPQIERIMVNNRVAANVTSIEDIRKVGMSTDYRIVYNEWR